MKRYRCQELGQLAHELTLSPLRQRLRQVSGILRAIDLIDPAKDYPYSFICFHITGYRPRRTEDMLHGGKPIVEDLVRMLEELTAANPLPLAFAGGRLYDVEALADRFNVSTKTISRWRKRGLAACWYAGGEKPQLAFCRRVIERFVSQNIDLVRRGASFQVMNDDEKTQIIRRARELVAAEKSCLHAVTLRIAEETGRAVETIRYTLRRFDEENVERALFDRAEQPTEIDETQVLLDAYEAGETIAALADRFDRNQGEIRDMLVLARARHLAAEPIEYMYNEVFDAPTAEHDILEASPFNADNDDSVDFKLVSVPGELPAYLKALYQTPLLNKVEERHLFRRMNFLLHMAEVRRRRFADCPEKADERELTDINSLLDKAGTVKNRLIQANLRLVVSIAKRHIQTNGAQSLFELVSDGNIALIRAVEKFDYAKGFRFSTYGSWAVMRSYARSVNEERAQRGRYQTGHEDLLAGAKDHRLSNPEPETDATEINATINAGLACLDERERSIVERHFGIGSRKNNAQTLEEIGRDLGISKERVRQVEIGALAKLRGRLGPCGAELLAG